MIVRGYYLMDCKEGVIWAAILFHAFENIKQALYHYQRANRAGILKAFQLIDNDKDGIIGKNDLRATFDSIGRLSSEKELDEMVGEASGPINFTQLLTLFANRMSGGSDDDDVVINAFKSFDDEGKIDSERLRHALMTWGDKFSADEVDEAYDQMEIDDKGFIDTQKLITMLTASAEEEDGGEAA
ncbi:Myosin light chain 2 [Operophtera brumata]|uniref:Myosin light chain 2 n=1 Tax=Operophtera brumata TaxID=104452 RepID=A0A0L7L5E3_OPEBR|nr:Myosin light chain 2 [Operophtera brumata]